MDTAVCMECIMITWEEGYDINSISSHNLVILTFLRSFISALLPALIIKIEWKKVYMIQGAKYSRSTTNNMQSFSNLFIFVRRSTCFRRFFRPSSGAQNCTYSVRHLSDRYCYLLLAAGSSNGLTNAWCCMCSFVLLTMAGKTVWNMQSVLRK